MILLFMSLIFGSFVCTAEVVVDPRVENPLMREALRKQAEAAEATKTNKKRSQTTKMPQQHLGPRPQRTLSENDLCTNELTVLASRESITKGGQPIQTCKMYLDGAFAGVLKEYIPKCAKDAANNGALLFFPKRYENICRL